MTILKFKRGAAGKMATCIDCLQPYNFHTHLAGREGSLLDNRFHSGEFAGPNKNRRSELRMPRLDWGKISDHPCQMQFAAFFDALEADKPMPLTRLDDALKTHEVVLTADTSADTRKPVKLLDLKE